MSLLDVSYNSSSIIFTPQAVKYPKSAYSYLQLLTGLSYDNPLVAKYKEWFPYHDIRKDEERG